MKLKPADLKTEQEAEHRMIDGEVFRFLDNEFFYDRENSQFVVYKDGYIERIKSYWNTVTEWQVEIPRTWEDDVREGKLVLCWVVNSDGIKMKNPLLIKGIADSFFDKYEDITGRLWKRAVPVAPDDPAIYKGGRNEIK